MSDICEGSVESTGVAGTGNNILLLHINSNLDRTEDVAGMTEVNDL